MAMTFTDENQYSNSPNERADTRLLAVRASIRPRLSTHSGTAGSHRCRMRPPATASTATTMTKKYQYIQPVTKPPRRPSACRA